MANLSNINNKFLVTTGGDVGINTTSPSKKLEVAGSYKLGTNSYIEYSGVYPYTISILNTAGVGNLIFNAGSGSAGYESKIELQGGTNGYLVFSTKSVERMRIASSGEVGISNTNPLFELCIGHTAAPNRNGLEFAIAGTDAGTNILQSYNRATAAYTPYRIAANTVSVLSGSNAQYTTTFAATGNVGIGTASPLTTLHVNQANDAQVLVQGTNKMALHQDAAWNSNILLGCYYDGSNIVYGTTNRGAFKIVGLHDSTTQPQTLSIYGANGAAAAGSTVTFNSVGFSQDEDGNVGIGTTSPSYLVHADATVATDPSYIVASSGSDFIVAIGSQNSPGVGQEAFVGTLSNDDLKIKSNNTERIRIKNTGNVGIGTTIANGKLHIADTSSSSTTQYFSAASNTATYSYIKHIDNTVNTAKLTLGTVYGYNVPVDAMTIFNGNVGIGTTSPDVKLHVYNGSNGATTVGTASNELILENDTDCGLTIRSGASSTGVISFASPTDHNVGQVYYDHADNSMTFKTNDNIAATINSSGNVGIGLTNPSQKLEVTGNFKLNGTLVQEGAGNNLTFRHRTGGSSSHSGGNALVKFGRLYWTPAHWVSDAPVIKVTLHCKYYQGERREYIIKAGYGDTNPVINELQPSSTGTKIGLLVGTTTSAGYNYAGQPVYYADLQLVKTIMRVHLQIIRHFLLEI